MMRWRGFDLLLKLKHVLISSKFRQSNQRHFWRIFHEKAHETLYMSSILKIYINGFGSGYIYQSGLYIATIFFAFKSSESRLTTVQSNLISNQMHHNLWRWRSEYSKTCCCFSFCLEGRELYVTFNIQTRKWIHF